MKYITRLALLLIIVSITISCFPGKELPASNTMIVPLSDTVKAIEGAIVYGLPRTVFTVKVEMERIIEVPGPYSRYAGDFLGLNDIIKNESELWSVVSIALLTHEELDPSEYYVVKSNNLFFSNVLALKKEGLILDLNPAIYNNIGYETEGWGRSGTRLPTYNLGSDEYYQVQRDTAFRRVKVDSLFARIPYIVEKKKSLPVEQLAERAARQLMEIREGKHLILTGEATVFPQNEAAINELNRMEMELTELFVGKSWTERKSFSYEIIPIKNMAGKRSEVFRFSELTGPISGTQQGGISVSIDLVPEQKTRALTMLNSQSAVYTAPKYDRLLYRVPDVVNMKIYIGDDLKYTSRKLIYQFGEVIQLPANYIIGK